VVSSYKDISGEILSCNYATHIVESGGYNFNVHSVAKIIKRFQFSKFIFKGIP
jgi:hypothetical protein